MPGHCGREPPVLSWTHLDSWSSQHAVLHALSPCADYLYDGAVMVTASHLPINRNGAKFCTARGGLEKKDIAWLLSWATEVGFHRWPGSCHGLLRWVSARAQGKGGLLGVDGILGRSHGEDLFVGWCCPSEQAWMLGLRAAHTLVW